jgi:hypothetical protein
LPQQYLPLSQLRHQQPQQPHQPKLKLRRTRKSLQKVSLRRKSQQKQTQSQPLSNLSLDDNDDLIIDDELTFGRNRRSEQFGKVVKSDELSDYVKFRLWLARQRAMAAYEKAHA